MSIRSLVLERFSQPQKCHGHCEGPATPHVVRDDGTVTVVATACDKGYVSRVVAYGPKDSSSLLRSLVSKATASGSEVKEEDIRAATRYAWDLGMEGSAKGAVFKASYWTQNYRRTESNDPDRGALFACTTCGSLFMQPLSSGSSLCPACSGA